ncbi:phosphatase PAP2 family protein [Streptomyces sp. NPDC018031]|uniref:phosphatase PAP2 family protein n=1 Tax=Streptomyces sp. NPDC018031 TaxID=3365033 RepID=UPI0037B509E5
MGEATVRTPEGSAAPSPIEETEAARPPRPSVLPRLRTPRRPRLWFEILLIGLSYWTYSLVRNAVPEQRGEALRNADWIWDWEHRLGLAFERSVNHAVDSVGWLIVGMNYYYATLHFIVTIAVLVWIYRWHPGRYAATRLVLFTTTGVALLGYYLFPLAPPRLMPGGGFIDTVVVHDTWGSMASGNLSEMSNQYAAMPSMHIGWSLWCGLTVAMLARLVWVKVLGLLYPAVTGLVIVATANHFWLDAVGGVLCLALGFALSFLWYRALCYRLPRVPAARAVAPGASWPRTGGAEAPRGSVPDRPEAPSGAYRTEAPRGASLPGPGGAAGRAGGGSAPLPAPGRPHR